MRVNEDTVLVGSKVVLVPYRKEHVKRYHEWMSDPEIRQQTASEPLSLDEEYAMQKSWHQDEDKLTFIILGRQDAANESSQKVDELLSTSTMAGDVNIFFSERVIDDDEEEGDENHDRAVPDDKEKVYDAELEVMIAEPSQRRRGLAREALSMLMHYATSESATVAARPKGGAQTASILPVPQDAFVAKVGFANAPSMNMFTQLGFHEVKRSEVWKEIELRPDPQRSLLLSGPLAILQWPRQDQEDEENPS